MFQISAWLQRKNVEAIALDQNVAPRTLQRFLESIVWDEQLLRDRCQQMVAAEHAHPDAIGCIDETGHRMFVFELFHRAHRRAEIDKIAEAVENRSKKSGRLHLPQSQV